MTKPKIIFVSNRLPFNINAKTGELKRSSGGLVSALLGIQLQEPFYWFGFEVDSDIAKQIELKSRAKEAHLRVVPVVLDEKLYESYYDRFSNDVLWPLFHYESENVVFHRRDWTAYVEANQQMADKIAKIAGENDVVWIHDFHFMMLPKFLKEKKPNLKVGFFLHTPFPSEEIFRQLPVREELLKGLIKADLIGFHEHSYLRHFNVSLKSHLGVDSSFFHATVNGHSLQLGVYPIGIDNFGLTKKASTSKVKALTEKYKNSIKSSFLVLGIDRLDYSKGLKLKMRGFQRLLRKYPDLRGHINLLQVAVPSRIKVPAYIRLKKEIEQLVGNINGEFGQPGYVPVQYIFNSVTESELLALYRRAESILITSKRDGMNLVAIEYAVAQDLADPGTLILSEFAGAASLLGESIFINPWDEDSIADALYQAFHMPFEERRGRLESLQYMLSKYTSTEWAQSFLQDLKQTGKIKFKNRFTEVLPENSYGSVHRKMKTTKMEKLLIDYDGTLVALQKRPELAVLSDQFRQCLIELNKTIPVCIVSGRSKTFIDSQFPDCSFPLAAEHGGFYKEPGTEWRSRISSDIESWYSEVKKVMAAYAEKVPLSFVEVKEASLVWHYRQSPADFAKYQARRLDEELQVGLANLPVTIAAGSKIVEAKAIECDKGNFLRWIMEQDQSTNYICIGDDPTDEDMFRILDGRGISIKVGDGDTLAQYRVPTQQHILGFLQSLAHPQLH